MRARLLLIGWLLGSGAAQAQPSGAPVAPRAVGEQVFIAPSGEPFRAPQGAPYPVANWFAAADTNHDGRLSLSEFTASFAHFFDSLDTDHDGSLRSDEVKHYEEDVTPEVRSFGEGGGAGSRSGRHSGADPSQYSYQIDQDQSPDVGESAEIEGDLRTGPIGAGRYSLINIPEPIAAMDTDFNGIVTRNEMLSAARRRFALLDAQAKGFLTLADLPQTWAQAHPRGQRAQRGGDDSRERGRRRGGWHGGGGRGGGGDRDAGGF